MSAWPPGSKRPYDAAFSLPLWRTQLQGMLVADLKAVLKQCGLPRGGRKAELLARIQRAVEFVDGGPSVNPATVQLTVHRRKVREAVLAAIEGQSARMAAMRAVKRVNAAAAGASTGVGGGASASWPAAGAYPYDNIALAPPSWQLAGPSSSSEGRHSRAVSAGSASRLRLRRRRRI